MAALRLLVGLGNPSPRYENTRHNAGFWFVDEVASRLRILLREETRFQGLVGKHDGPGPLLLLKPTTFMNRSGSSIAALMRFYRLEPSDVLIAHDELDLSPGTVRLKRGGGHGGHNGLRDTLAHLGSAEFHRLRLGIGHPGDRDRVADYVLEAPSGSERVLIDGAIEAALKSLPDLLAGDFGRAMNQINATAKGGGG